MMFKRLSFLLFFFVLQIFPAFSMEETQVISTYYECSCSLEGEVSECSFSPDGRCAALALGCGDSNVCICIWDTDTGELRDLGVLERPVLALEFSIDGTYFAAISGMNVYVWNVETGILLHDLFLSHNFIKYDNWLVSLALGSDVRRLVAGDFRGDLYMFDLQTNEFRYSKAPYLYSLPHGYDGRQPLAGDTWNINTDGLMLLSGMLTDSIDLMRLSCDGTHLLTVSSTGVISKWNLGTNELSRNLISEDKGRQNTRLLAFSLDGRFLSAISKKNVVYVWNVEECKLAWSFSLNEDVTRLDSLGLNYDGTRLFVSFCSGEMRMFDVASKSLLRSFNVGTSGNSCFSKFSPDGMRIILGLNRKTYLYVDRKIMQEKIAFASAMHLRLGEESLVSVLPQEIVREILDYI